MGLAARLAVAAALLGGIGAAAGWVVTEPRRLDRSIIAAMGDGDAARGERIFHAGGCSSCHARPGSDGAVALELAGGLELKTPFGTFVPPNISSDPLDGIGAWSTEDFANAMLRGVSPSGDHYYPAFPYASYARMQPADIADLHAFMKTLPAVAGKAPGNSLGFPFNVRRGLGLWKLLNVSDEPVIALPADAPEPVKLGRYLVEGPGHCGECHTPRDLSGGSRTSQWLAGAPAAEGSGTVPNITPGEEGIGSWSEGDIASFLETGFTPEFDSPGGAMAEVVKNTARLTPEDRAAYLKTVPAQANGYPPRQAPVSP